ncbi:MAG TPA: hypothetical protein PKD74_01245 [Candidatus Dependentiae bacterium]|nr:hypothetical protein [Candidatus Dependentiae bacterium]
MTTQLASYLGSVLLGCCFGLLYGLLFIHQKKGALFNGQNSWQYWPNQIVSTFVRYAGIAFIVWYLLPLSKIHFILVMLNFFVFFWVVIIQYKGYPRE